MINDKLKLNFMLDRMKSHIASGDSICVAKRKAGITPYMSKRLRDLSPDFNKIVLYYHDKMKLKKISHKYYNDIKKRSNGVFNDSTI